MMLHPGDDVEVIEEPVVVVDKRSLPTWLHFMLKYVLPIIMSSLFIYFCGLGITHFIWDLQRKGIQGLSKG
jgi:hypothetical protein